MRTLRRNALEKLAALSATTTTTTSKGPSDLTRLCKICTSHSWGVNGVNSHDPAEPSPGARVPMTLPEFETLVALCKAAPLVQARDAAFQLLRQISPYLAESACQAVASSPSLRSLGASPWETLTFNLASAVLALGVNHPDLRDLAAAAVKQYTTKWARFAEALGAEQYGGAGSGERSPTETDICRIVTLTTSLLGFLRAAAGKAVFWPVKERLPLIEMLGSAISERFMTALETALSLVRNARHSQKGLREWKRYYKHYAADGRPLGAMLLRKGFMEVVLAFASLLVASPDALAKDGVLDILRRGDGRSRKFPPDQTSESLLEGAAEIAAEEIRLLEEGSDYLRLGSAWQQRLASSVKGSSITSFLCCTVRNEEIADADILMSWLESVLADPVQSSDESLADVVLKSMAVLGTVSPSIAASLGRSLPRLVVQGGFGNGTAGLAADCLASTLKLLPEDTVITTLYTLGNVLSTDSVPDRSAAAGDFIDGSTNSPRATGLYKSQAATGSSISLAPTDVEEPSTVYTTVIQSIVRIATACNDEKINALAQSMLVQKIGRVNLLVDAKIITETAYLGACADPSELKSLLKLYAKLCHDALVRENFVILESVRVARLHLSRNVSRDSPLYEIYLVHLLDTIISKGDAHENDNKHLADAELAAQEIAQMLPPLATLVSAHESPETDEDNDTVTPLMRDAWFNLVVHGFNLSLPLGQKYTSELKVLAYHSRPLIAQNRADGQLESDIELNIVLRRGKSPEHVVDQKRNLMAALPPNCEPEVKSLSYPEVVFLNATHLVECLRANGGDCTKALAYFLDPKLRSGGMGHCMVAIANGAVRTFLSRTMTGTSYAFSTPYVAQQLAGILAGCCHRISKVQQVATACADMIITRVPSALCQRKSLFALLELLTIMWSSCLEMDTDEYEWTAVYQSRREGIWVELSDDFAFRRATLSHFHKWAREWVIKVMNIAPLDIKGLLQTYLSEHDDDGAYGHVSLGRSFALEMGSVIPSTDQRLGAIEQQPEVHINTASDFIAQYTSRQEYRFVDGIQDHDHEWLKMSGDGGGPFVRGNYALEKNVEDAASILAELESRTLSNKHVAIAELRDVLRRAAALLCRVRKDQCRLLHHLVGIPFAVFTKQAIKLGISLWMSVIKENPRMESRVLAEIAENWENTVRKRRGLFALKFHHKDPFYIKQEFAPSDKDATWKRQQFAYNLISPHFRLLQFLSSHFNATRLGTPHLQRIYDRLIHVTLDAMAETTNHPLAREVHFHIVLLGLRILRFSTSLDTADRWRLKDKILSAALRWFSFEPRWSFGGNRLQIKAETHLLADIQQALQDVDLIGSKAEGSLKSLRGKQDLLLILLTSEQTRLMVWLFPLDYDKRHHFASGQNYKQPAEAALCSSLKTAWTENPALAIQLARRFSFPKLKADVRWLLLNFPTKALWEPDALELLLGPSLPDDVHFQLKYLLFWAPVNPITAVTYFLPAYGNHPFVIQYAMRALESHSVDVTFFYVPQIVQTLRYDVLGYVERYILETAKFSQLFAHQIIWNMKANAYKDEDSQVPDPVKPTLDKVMNNLEASFHKKDRAFYDREFAFFNEVTGISGKLRPYIKKSKPEKKQKIEEELRQIKVEVGVYLPSNPDGVVVGIDRKSGKPLQSHAKAPYMATFRIRKEKGAKPGSEDSMGNAVATVNGSHSNSAPSTFEVWQSAIFKVGDDCRQDVLALQMIAAFRGIFNNVGLDVYVNPYRVTATAPGCGVIDVLPNSISRDMLGREAVNGLYDYFVSKYGGPDSLRFQEARSNFVKSMAAYSVISYLLQFKDRHNGNIMIDDAGHILHIDFGFCFDIAPGGIRFERAPFKLTSEMVAVMGGSTTSQPYHWFEELCIKAFLASRQHCEHLAHIVVVMLDSGLPCFKPETIQHFRDRFVLDKSEREAADFMRDLIKKSYSSYSTKGYDQFQLLTNGIPY